MSSYHEDDGPDGGKSTIDPLGEEQSVGSSGSLRLQRIHHSTGK